MNNQDKAKKILFGNKNIGADPLWDTDQAKAYENITRKLNEAGVPVTNPDEGDEFVTDKYGDIFLAGDVNLMDGIAFDCQTGQRKSVLIVATVDSWYVKIEAYCKEAGITPEQLIEQHKVAYKDL